MDDENGHCFVEWKEQFVSKERGNRVVHYFLKDVSGEFILAVVGTERSVRHMFYVVSGEFLSAIGEEDSANNAGYRWRSRREVVNWLTSMLSPQHQSKSPKNDDDPTYNLSCQQTEYKGHLSRNLRGHTSNIVWIGTPWMCGKQLKHYPSFRRNGIEIAVRSFVFVLAEEENQYLAYLEDMYEDRKGQKKVRVRWFHRNQEVERVVSLRNSHPKEVFITPYAQLISAECVDGPAIVLMCEHYEKFLEIIPRDLLARVYLCHRQFKSNRLKPFKLSKFNGYFDQPIFACVGPDFFEDEEFSLGENAKVGAKKPRICRGGPITLPQKVKCDLFSRKMIKRQHVGMGSVKVNDKIELLSQDSGIRGCWFRCTVLEVSRKQMKVRYDDVKDEDGCGNLEEWVPTFGVAMPDELRMRHPARPTIRPAIDHPHQMDHAAFAVGSPVDVWWSDGWWEGVVAAGISDSENEESLRVCVPSENLFLNINRKDLRVSKDWTGDKWVEIKSNPEIASKLCSSIDPETGNSVSSIAAQEPKSGNVPQSCDRVLTATKLDTVEGKEKPRPDSGNLSLLENHVKDNNSANVEDLVLVQEREDVDAANITNSSRKEREGSIPHDGNDERGESETGAKNCESELLEIVA